MGTQPVARKTGADPVKVDAKHYKVQLENEKVRVLRISYGPHEKSEMHAHPAALAILLTDHHAKFTFPNGRSEERRAKAGDILWFPAEEHLPENLAGTKLELILVELKS